MTQVFDTCNPCSIQGTAAKYSFESVDEEQQFHRPRECQEVQESLVEEPGPGSHTLPLYAAAEGADRYPELGGAGRQEVGGEEEEQVIAYDSPAVRYPIRIISPDQCFDGLTFHLQMRNKLPVVNGGFVWKHDMWDNRINRIRYTNQFKK